MNEITNSDLNLVTLYISAGRFQDAANLIHDLSGSHNTSADFLDLQSLIIDIKTRPELTIRYSLATYRV